MLKTKYGQTAYELGSEFLKALQEMSTEKDNSDAETLFDYYVQMERINPMHNVVIDMVTKRNNGVWDMRTLPILVNNRMPVSYLLLAWLGPASRDIPEYVTTFLGCMAAVFYKDHKPTDMLTLEWLGQHGGRGRIIHWTQIFPWATAAKMEDDKNIFEVINFKEEYSAEVSEEEEAS